MSFSLHEKFLAESSRRRWLLAISGGRDSVALLHRLLEMGYGNLVLCHVNHGLRGAESGQDAAFVRRLAAKYQLDCEVARLDVAALAEKNHQSVELAARQVRYDFFSQCAKKYRCPRVIVAHHADDQAETVLFNLLRGSAGLRGMRVCTSRQVNGFLLGIWRPMLETARSEIDDYVAAHGVRFREDSSNAQPIATRNRLRNEALPLLSEIMGRDVSPLLGRAAKLGEHQHDALAEALEGLEINDPQGRIYLPKYQSLPRAMRLFALREFLKKNNISDIDNHLLERCDLVAMEQKSNGAAKTNLPAGRFFRRKEKRLFID